MSRCRDWASIGIQSGERVIGRISVGSQIQSFTPLLVESSEVQSLGVQIEV